MKAKIINFPREKIVNNRGSQNFLLGYAAGVCDVWRQGGEYAAESALKESDISLQEFINANIEEYDLETLQEMFRSISP